MPRTALPVLGAGAAIPLAAFTCLLVGLGGAGASIDLDTGVCGGGGTAAVIGGVAFDAEQLANARTVVIVTARRRLPAYAALVAVTTAYTESRLHNTTTQTDHDSEGLFQQRVSVYGTDVADDPVRASNAFLDRLVRVPHWQIQQVGVDAQTVQRSRFPQRYQPNAGPAAQLLGRYWPSATASTGAAICPGGGGAQPAGTITGPTGNTIAGSTVFPAGLVIKGSLRATRAVRFALAQLGKPYVFGAAGPDSFDCSGLTMAAWASAGRALPHLAAAQADVGAAQPTDLSTARAGDLVLIPGSDGTPQHPGHVGMIAGYVDHPAGRHLYLIQAPETGVPVELTEATEWTGHVVAVRHLA
jgi:cell wall-associated NlpC family hydrolase